MPWEQDREVIEWFERTLADGRPQVRSCAVELLEYVACAEREHWLRLAECDPEPSVASSALLVRLALARESEDAALELLESDFVDGLEDSDLEWEWEYTVKVCREAFVPTSGHLVWTATEDESTAKRLALMKAFPRERPPADAVPIVVAKRVVSRYTRSPRTFSEAMLWHQRGRPRYSEPDARGRGDGGFGAAGT